VLLAWKRKVEPEMTEVHSLSAPADAPLRPQGGTDLGAKVASRICHDLSNPLGAIANGLELLLMTGLEPSPEMSLLQDSVASASARIRWFRLAFGPAGPQRVGRAEVTDILGAISRGTRLSYDWTCRWVGASRSAGATTHGR
jgi:hypothetical protein